MVVCGWLKICAAGLRQLSCGFWFWRDRSFDGGFASFGKHGEDGNSTQKTYCRTYPARSGYASGRLCRCGGDSYTSHQRDTQGAAELHSNIGNRRARAGSFLGGRFHDRVHGGRGAKTHTQTEREERYHNPARSWARG